MNIGDLRSGRVNRVELRKAQGDAPELLIDGKPVEAVTGFALKSMDNTGLWWEATVSFHTFSVVLDLDTRPEPPSPREIERAEDRGFARGFAAAREYAQTTKEST